MKWNLAILLSLALLMTACGGRENPLTGTDWRLIALGDSGAPVAVIGGEPTARFTTDRDMTGWTGCNSYGATYDIGESELNLGDDLQWTEAGCPSRELFDQEQLIQDLLATLERFEIAGEQLKLYSAGGKVLVFERVAG